MQNDQEIFAGNAAPFNTIKLLSASVRDSDRRHGCVKKHIIDIATQTVSKESQLSAQSTKSVTIVKQKNGIISIAMNNDTHTLFVSYYIGIIKQFQKEDSSLNYYTVRIFEGHNNMISSISLSNSKMYLLSASFWDKTLRVWDLQNGNQLACLNDEAEIIKGYGDNIFSCCWNDQDTLFASGRYNGVIVVWSLPFSIYNTSNQFIPLLKFKNEDYEVISCLKFQENGMDLFASYFEFCNDIMNINDHDYDSNSIVMRWSINEKKLMDSKSTHQQNATLPLIKKLIGSIRQFDVRGSMLVVSAYDEIFSLSADSLQSMADAVEFEKVHNRLISSLVFSKDGKYVASGSEDASVAIFDSKSGKCVKLIKDAHSDWIQAVVFEI